MEKAKGGARRPWHRGVPGGLSQWTGGRLALRALLGGAPEVEIGGRRFRLSQEKVFRLEEVDGGFVYYLRNAGALQRRLAELMRRHPGPGRELPGPWCDSLPHN